MNPSVTLPRDGISHKSDRQTELRDHYVCIIVVAVGICHSIHAGSCRDVDTVISSAFVTVCVCLFVRVIRGKWLKLSRLTVN